MSEMPNQQEESKINTNRRAFKRKLRLSFILLFILVTIVVGVLAANISKFDKLAAQVICTVDGKEIYPIEEFVCSNENGMYADGILMFGATHLDYVSDMDRAVVVSSTIKSSGSLHRARAISISLRSSRV